MSSLLRAFWGMIPLTALALPYALLCWPVLTARRRRRVPDAYRASTTAGLDVLLCLLGLLVAALVTMPVGNSDASMLDLVPGADLVDAFRESGSIWQVAGNLLLLLPIAALLPLRVRRLRSIGRIALAALAASVLVEGTQYLIHDGRVTSTDDVLLNTAGATLGAALSRRWWRCLDMPVTPPRIPVHIPAQIRRTICEAPTLSLRVPRSVWDVRYAGVAHPERR